jgi:hypothetical protein
VFCYRARRTAVHHCMNRHRQKQFVFPEPTKKTTIEQRELPTASHSLFLIVTIASSALDEAGLRLSRGAGPRANRARGRRSKTSGPLGLPMLNFSPSVVRPSSSLWSGQRPDTFFPSGLSFRAHSHKKLRKILLVWMPRTHCRQCVRRHAHSSGPVGIHQHAKRLGGAGRYLFHRLQL